LLRLVGDVEPMRLAADLARYLFGGRLVDIRHRNPRACLRQGMAGRPADAVAAAGHQRDPPVETQHAQIVAHQPPRSSPDYARSAGRRQGARAATTPAVARRAAA
jgi:hypothetical protein